MAKQNDQLWANFTQNSGKFVADLETKFFPWALVVSLLSTFFYSKSFTHKRKKITTINRYITNYYNREHQKIICSNILENI